MTVGNIYRLGDAMKNEMNIVTIIQARMGSTRLPGKVLMEICGKPVLWHIVQRASQSLYTNKIVIATSVEEEDNAIAEFAQKNGFLYYRGSQNNVLERFYQCAQKNEADIIVRLTADNSLIDAHIIDRGIAYFKQNLYDYIYYTEGLPVGMAVEIFSYAALKQAYQNANDLQCLEHVTPYLYKNPHLFHARRIPCEGRDNSKLRWTLDTERDKQLIMQIYECLYNKNPYFAYEDILEEYERHPMWQALNRDEQQIEITYQGDIAKGEV